jgi:hypothetical protein
MQYTLELVEQGRTQLGMATIRYLRKIKTGVLALLHNVHTMESPSLALDLRGPMIGGSPIPLLSFNGFGPKKKTRLSTAPLKTKRGGHHPTFVV